jgi:hypothetical protein
MLEASPWQHMLAPHCTVCGAVAHGQHGGHVGRTITGLQAIHRASKVHESNCHSMPPESAPGPSIASESRHVDSPDTLPWRSRSQSKVLLLLRIMSTSIDGLTSVADSREAPPPPPAPGGSGRAGCDSSAASCGRASVLAAQVCVLPRWRGDTRQDLMAIPSRPVTRDHASALPPRVARGVLRGGGDVGTAPAWPCPERRGDADRVVRARLVAVAALRPTEAPP